MARKLQYFNLNGLAEPIRYILHYSGVKFEDVRYDFQSWPIKGVKDSLPYGQLPLYEENGRVLNQSLAIARYLASQTNPAAFRSLAASCFGLQQCSISSIFGPMS
nr:glutathione S-transferase sigma 2 [Conogethes punctiferalis]